MSSHADTVLTDEIVPRLRHLIRHHEIVGNSRVQSMEVPLAPDDDCRDDTFTLGDVLASEAEDPSETAARKLDWQAFAATLDDRTLEVLQCMDSNARLQEAATRRGVCRSTVQSWRNQLTELVRSFMGARVLHMIQRTPRWREDLTAMREHLACRMDRRVAA